MPLRHLSPIVLGLALLSACSGSSDEEDAEAAALSGGPDLDSYVNSSRTDGDTPGIKWVPAGEGALQYGRPGPVNYVVIHDIDGSGRGAVATFTRAGGESSIHYVVDKNGLIVQMVHEQDTANHAFQTVFNGYAIGIEHAGFAADNGYTDKEYDASSTLVAKVVAKYHIPIDRKHIVGHYQVPKADTSSEACPENATTCGGQSGHLDPGVHWDWSRYMQLLTTKAAALGYSGATAAEQAARKLVTVNPLENLPLSRVLFGGYYATQCRTDDTTLEEVFRSINGPDHKPRLESRYNQPRANECGNVVNGVYPIVFHGLPTSHPSRPDLDTKGLVIDPCVARKKRQFRSDGTTTVSCSRNGGNCEDVVAPFIGEAGGC